MYYLDLTKTFVKDSFWGKVDHFDRALYRLLYFNPSADEVFHVATYAHDIERPFKDSTLKVENYLDPVFLERHQEWWAKIIGEKLYEWWAENKFIERVKHLIRKHEVWGDEDQTLLMNIDSLSFMETNAINFVEYADKKWGYDIVREKIDRMYNRINIDYVKEIAKPLYEQHIAWLNQKFDRK